MCLSNEHKNKMFSSLKGAPIEDFIKTSVRQTVQHNYNENNTAAMMTFDKIQEGVGFNSRW